MLALMAAAPKLLKATPVLIRKAGLDERWVQDQIVADPSILGLGEVIVRDKERPQPHAGRLDLLLEDTEDQRRYEVELQLGGTDETHIIRCIEYWDLERARYPQYEHSAVLIAENITARFLNVVRLFNGQIPLIAIQMQAFTVADGICLTFIKVVDELRRGPEDDDSGPTVVADRSQWDKRIKPEMMAVADRVFVLAKQIDPKIEMSYLQDYIGVRIDGRASNFFSMSPRRKFWIFSFRHPESKELEAQMAAAEFDLVGRTSWGAYEVRLTMTDLEQHEPLVKACLQSAYTHWMT
jgi:predicted transport protein